MNAELDESSGAEPPAILNVDGAARPDLSQVMESLLNETQTATFLNVKKGWLQKQRHFGKGPPYIFVGRSIRYRPSELEKYLVENTVRPR